MTKEQQNTAILAVSVALITAGVAMYAGMAASLLTLGLSGILYILARD